MGMLGEFLVVFCVASGIIGSRIAKSKGRDPLLGFAIGLILPAVGAAAVCFMKEQKLKRGAGRV